MDARGVIADTSMGGARVSVPSTIGNFGPGFDVFSLAIERPGEEVRMAEADEDEIRVHGPGADRVPVAWNANCAARAVDHVRSTTGADVRVRIELQKGAPPGSGLGSSASSSAGAAMAFLALVRDELATEPAPLDAIRAAAEGERQAAGVHYDDVSAAVLGGLAIVRTGPPLHVQRFDPPENLHLGIVTPSIQLDTKAMRRILPKDIPREDAVANIAAATQLLAALARGDIDAAGACMEDRLASVYRAPHVPGFDAMRAAAAAAGGAGFLLCGSGPSVATLADNAKTAEAAAKAMLAALESEGHQGFLTVTRAETREVFRDALVH